MSHSTLGHNAEKPKQTRVHWTNTDLKALLSFDSTLADPKLDAVTLLARLRRAQEKALPPARQRASRPLYNFVSQYRPQFQAALKALMLVPDMPRGITYTSKPQGYHSPVRWRPNELRLIAESVAALLKPSLRLEPGALADAILRAQVRCLPPERHRTRGGIYQALFLPGSRSLHLMLCDALRQPAPAPLRAPAIVVAPPALAPAPAKAQAKPAPAPAPQAEPAKPSMSEMAERIAQHCMTLMRAEMADMLAMVVRTTLIDVLGAPASPAPVPPPPPPPPPAPAPVQVAPKPAPQPERPRRSRVDVVGLIGGQMQIVQQAIGDRLRDSLDLRFITVGEAGGRTKSYSEDVVVCTKFVDHTAQNSIKARGGRVRLHYANGGAASVIDVLRALPVVQDAVASAH